MDPRSAGSGASSKDPTDTGAARGRRMAAEKAPAFQFYPKEFLMDGNVAGMSLQERGAYITLLCLCWQEGSLPAQHQRLARMIGAPIAAFNKLWPAVGVCFREVEGRLIHPRLEKERDKQEEFRRRQSNKGRASAASRNHGSTAVQPEPQPKVNSPISYLRSPDSSKNQEKDKKPSLSPAAPADPFLDDGITQRAGRFLERYQELYPKYKHGARYALKPHRDYAAAVRLCQTWDNDERLEKLAIIFLTTDHKFAEEGSRTVPQFLALASWCDTRLAEAEAGRAS